MIMNNNEQTGGCMGLRALDNEDMARQSQVLLATVTRRAAAIARVLARIGVERRTTTGTLRVMSWRMMRFWYLESVAANAILKRMPQNDEATVVFHECFRAGC